MSNISTTDDGDLQVNIFQSQKYQMQEKGNFDFICLKQNHQKPIIMVIMDENISSFDRLLCENCFHNIPNPNRVISIRQAVTMVQERMSILDQNKQIVKNKLYQDLVELQEKLSQLRTNVMNSFNENLRILEMWIKELSQEDSLVLDQKELIKNLQILVEKNIQQDQYGTQSYYKKLELAFQKLLTLDDLIACNDQMEKIQEKIMPKIQIQKPQIKLHTQTLITCKQVSSVRQTEQVSAIAFNNQGDIMAAGCNSFIKLWKFEKDKLTEMKQLKGHTDNVYCLVFSKNQNWFASGGRDNTIRSWKQYPNQDWRGSDPQKIHSSYIMCLILNHYEDQLISCSMDKMICVWNVNCQTNSIQFDYSLAAKHQGYIYCISMNQSETALVSCGKDKLIILWVKGDNQRWVYKSQITNDDYGQRICFISETEIIWQEFGKGISHFFENINGFLRKKSETIILNQQQDGECLFPTIFNKQKDILIQKHSSFVYLISKSANNGKFVNIAYQIVLKGSCNYGSLTSDGEHLVIWSLDSYEFRVYNLKFQ